MLMQRDLYISPRISKGHMSCCTTVIKHMAYLVSPARRRYNPRIQENCKKLYHSICPEKLNNFLPSNRRVLASYVINHNSGHNNGDDVDKTGCYQIDVSYEVIGNMEEATHRVERSMSRQRLHFCYSM